MITCQRVTGIASPQRGHMVEEKRRGKQLDDGRWEVVCSNTAHWIVERPGQDSIRVCNRDLASVIDRQAVVTRIAPEGDDNA